MKKNISFILILLVLFTAMPSLADTPDNLIDTYHVHYNEKTDDNTILRYPAHPCHNGPDHRKCEWIATIFESCGCTMISYQCCCGYDIEVTGFLCEEHRY